MFCQSESRNKFHETAYLDIRPISVSCLHVACDHVGLTVRIEHITEHFLDFIFHVILPCFHPPNALTTTFKILHADGWKTSSTSSSAKRICDCVTRNNGKFLHCNNPISHKIAPTPHVRLAIVSRSCELSVLEKRARAKQVNFSLSKGCAVSSM